MVYLREIIEKSKKLIFQDNNIELVAYFYLSSPEKLTDTEFNLSPEEKESLKGYRQKNSNLKKILSIVNKPPIKGISAFSNIFKFGGLYLASKEILWSVLIKKYFKSNLKQKYFLYKIEPKLKDLFYKDVKDISDPYANIIMMTCNQKEIVVEEIGEFLQKVVQNQIDILDILILEDIERTLLNPLYMNYSIEDVFRTIFRNFSNSIQQITGTRRKDHNSFVIKDEYDVQDIMYVILKALFPEMKYEDPVPKNGGQSTKVDFIFRKENILLEIKMIKEQDANELRFINQLKIDFESYHECQWLKKLFCFVYDPLKKTRDDSNFYDLNGERKKGNHTYNVEIILSH